MKIELDLSAIAGILKKDTTFIYCTGKETSIEIDIAKDDKDMYEDIDDALEIIRDYTENDY